MLQSLEKVNCGNNLKNVIFVTLPNTKMGSIKE